MFGSTFPLKMCSAYSSLRYLTGNLVVVLAVKLNWSRYFLSSCKARREERKVNSELKISQQLKTNVIFICSYVRSFQRVKKATTLTAHLPYRTYKYSCWRNMVRIKNVYCTVVVAFHTVHYFTSSQYFVPSNVLIFQRTHHQKLSLPQIADLYRSRVSCTTVTKVDRRTFIPLKN